MHSDFMSNHESIVFKVIDKQNLAQIASVNLMIEIDNVDSTVPPLRVPTKDVSDRIRTYERAIATGFVLAIRLKQAS